MKETIYSQEIFFRSVFFSPICSRAFWLATFPDRFTSLFSSSITFQSTQNTSAPMFLVSRSLSHKMLADYFSVWWYSIEYQEHSVIWFWPLDSVLSSVPTHQEVAVTIPSFAMRDFLCRIIQWCLQTRIENGELRRLHNEEFQILYRSPKIVRVIIFIPLGDVGHPAKIKEGRSALKFFKRWTYQKQTFRKS